ncbi:MAG: fused MFS/spermidine synthase [Planctomycetota bacterium]
MSGPPSREEAETGLPRGPAAAGLSIGFGVETLLLLVFFLASGASGLILEVVWSRMLTLVFGSTSLAYATVLAAFMGGLALGAWLASRYADRIRDPLLAYGILEGAVAVFALLLPFYLDTLVPLYQMIWREWNPSFLTFSLLRFVLAASALILPTTCMGATLPILGRYYAERRSGLGLQVSHLYAANTWGAFAGTLAAGFALLPLLGESATIRAAVGINLAIFLVIAGLRLAGAGRPGEPASKPREGDAPLLALSPLPRSVVLAATAAYFGSGLAGMAAQIAWTRSLSLLIGSSVYAFTAVVAAYLVGIAAGSSVYAAWGRRVQRDPSWLAGAHLCAGACMIAGIYLFPVLPYLSFDLHSKFQDYPRIILLVQVLLSILLIFPAAFFLGGIFPATAKICARSPGRVGRDIGRAYAANTVGAIVGSFLGGFIFLFVDALGFQDGLCLGRPILVWTIGLGGLCLCLGALVVSLSGSRPGIAPEARGGVRQIALAAIYLPVLLLGLLPAYMESGEFSDLARNLGLTKRPPGERILVLVGPERGISYHLTNVTPADPATRRERDWTIGRDSKNRIPLSDPSVPDRAAKLFVEGDAWTIEALSPGVQVEGRPLEKGSKNILAFGDRILVGRTMLAFERDPGVRLWDPTLMSSGVFYYVDSDDGADPRRDDDPVFYREGVTTTVTVFQDSIREDNLYYLVVNGKVDASTRGDMKTQVLLAHLPILAHPSRSPKDVLVIGWGSGTTVGSCLNYPPSEVRKVLACELEKSVIEGSRWFESVNSKPREHLATGRLEIQANDARNYLLATDRMFDVVISEPSNPWISGAAKLFTREFYESASRRLNPDGIWCQWIQAYGLKRSDFKTLLATFRETFPHVAVFTDYESDLYVLGSKSPLAFDVAAIEKVLADHPGVSGDLARKNVDITGVHDLLAHHIFGSRTMNEFLGKGAIALNTDDNARIEFSTPLSLLSDERSEIDSDLVGAIDPEGAPFKTDPARPHLKDELLLRIAAWHSAEARHPAALEMLNGVIGRDPTLAGAYAERARIRLAKAKTEKRTALESLEDPVAPFRPAADDLEAALDIDPTDPRAQVALREFLKTLGANAYLFEELKPYLPKEPPSEEEAPPAAPGDPIEAPKAPE